jgi:RuvA, C-terminal domain
VGFLRSEARHERRRAHRRITVARIVRSFPRALACLERGEVHLCALYELRHHLTEENHEELLREASGMSTRAVQEMVAARFPKPDVPPRVDVVGEQAALLLASAAAYARSATANAPASLSASALSASALSAVRGPRPTVAPLSATRYRVELTISAEMKAKLDRVRDLMRHRNPTGDLERIVGDSLDLLLAKLEKERLGKTSRPRKSKTAAAPHPPPRVPTTEGPASDEAAETAATMKGLPPHLGIAKTDAGSAPAHPSVPKADDGSAPPATTDASNRTARPAATTADTRNALETTAETMAVESDAFARPATTSADSRAMAVTKTCEIPCPSATAIMKTLSAPATNAIASNVAPRSDHARRYISRETRRAVFARGKEQCTYVDADGHRCPARGFLELDHVHAKALGGSDAPANLRVRCRVHNHHHAEQTFGREFVAARIHLQRRKYDAPRSDSFESVDRALRSLGFRELEVRQTLATLQTKADAAVMPVETLLREALRLLT